MMILLQIVVAYYWMNNMKYLKQKALKRVRKHNVAFFLLVS